MKKRELLLILKRILENYDCDYVNSDLTINSDYVLKSLGFSREKLDEEIKKLNEHE